MIPHDYTFPPVPCYLRVLGDEEREGEKRRMGKGGYRRTTGGPSHPDMEAWLLKAWAVSSLANYILVPSVTVLWTLSYHSAFPSTDHCNP